MARYSVDIEANIKGFDKLDNIEKQIKSIQQSSKNSIDLKFDVDADGLKGINKQFDSLGKSAGKSFETAIQKQINTMAKTQRNAFSEPLKNITKVQKSYDDFWNKELSKPKNKNYGKNSQLLAFEEFNKQMLTQAKKAEEIRKRVSQGFTDVDTSAIKKSLNKYVGLDSNTLREAEASYSKLISLQKELKTGISDDSFKKTLSDKDVISRAEQYIQVLEKCKNQIKVLSNESGSISKPFNQLDAVVAGNKTLTWLNNNTKAAKEYGEVLEDLARKQKSATDGDELANYNKQVKSIISEAQAKGLAGKSAIDEIGRAFKQIGQFTSVYGLLQNVIYEVPQQMVQAVKDINKSQIELTKVSTASTSELSSYWDRAVESAKKYGSTVSDVINSTADWSRLGYSLKDAEKLSDATTLLNKVGDNMTQESSSSGLISTLRGFQLQAEQAESIVDKVNEIANTQPIDTSGIFAGLERSASSMSAANNTLEETIALITAANSVVQDPASVGTAFKTISMRIRGAETELEQAGLETDGMAESIAKLRQEIMALSGIDIMIDNDTFKSTYDILDELSNKWKDLTDIQQASVTELIAGKRQGNVVSALMTNFDIARNSLDTALNDSEGSASRELENWNKGIEASVKHFKAQFQELASVTISSDFFKGLVDSGTNAINIITQIIDKVGILTPLIAGFATKNGLGKRNATLYKVKQNNRRFINVESFIA